MCWWWENPLFSMKVGQQRKDSIQDTDATVYYHYLNDLSHIYKISTGLVPA